MNYKQLLLCAFLVIGFTGKIGAQEVIDWKVLSDVRFTSHYSKDLGVHYLRSGPL